MASHRPKRKQPAPAPIENAQYCHTCGRVMSHAPPSKKYCSHRCRATKPPISPSSLERRIETTFISALSASTTEKKVVACGEIEALIFRPTLPPPATSARSPSPSDGNDGGGGDGDSGGGDDSDTSEGGVHLADSETTPTAPTPISRGFELKGRGGGDKQAVGMQKAREREMVRQAARRLVAFGISGGNDADGGDRGRNGAESAVGGTVNRGGKGGEKGGGEGGERGQVEAVQNGRVVEASFAKGEWGVRWRS